MRIPHTINQNTYEEYAPSEQATNLLHEKRRKVKSEDPRWDEDHLPSLTELCVRILVADFKKRQIIHLLPCNDKNLLLETLPTDLSLPLVTRYLDDGVYWKRMVHDRWKDTVNHVEDYGFSWKRMYMEKHAQEAFEAMTPEGFDLKEVRQICRLVSQYVHKLDIRQLQILQPNIVDDDADDCSIVPEPRDHIDLSPIIMGLKNLTELHIQFGIRNVGSDYKKVWFQFSIQDCRNIGKGVAEATELRLLRIHHSTLDDDKVIALLSQMTKNESLEELDFSHCIIGDEGATAVAKFLKGRNKMKIVNLCNNKIREGGISALAFVLTQPECSPIEELSLRLNTFGDVGLRYLASALIRENPKVQTLNLSCCDLGVESGVLLGEMLSRNAVLIDLDLSNNRLGQVAGAALESGLSGNRTLQFLDLRMTGVANQSLLDVNRHLHFNRIRARKGESGVERELKRLETMAQEEAARARREAEKEAELEAEERALPAAEEGSEAD